MIEFKYLQAASKDFLCEEFPDNWESMTQEQKDYFICEAIWEPFEGYSAKDVFKLIEDAAWCRAQDAVAKDATYLVNALQDCVNLIRDSIPNSTEGRIFQEGVTALAKYKQEH